MTPPAPGRIDRGHRSGAGAPAGAAGGSHRRRAASPTTARACGRPDRLRWVTFGPRTSAQIDVDVLDLRVLLEGVHAVLTADARHLVAAERAPRCGHSSCSLTEMTPDRTAFTVRIALAMSRVPDRARQAVGRVVGQPNRPASSVSKGMTTTTGRKPPPGRCASGGDVFENGRLDIKRLARTPFSRIPPPATTARLPPAQSECSRAPSRACRKLTIVPTSVASSSGSPTLTFAVAARTARRHGRGRSARR